jgi:hypothetical protein
MHLSGVLTALPWRPEERGTTHDRGIPIVNFSPRLPISVLVLRRSSIAFRQLTTCAGVAKLADAPDLGFRENSATAATWPKLFTGQN